MGEQKPDDSEATTTPLPPDPAKALFSAFTGLIEAELRSTSAARWARIFEIASRADSLVNILSKDVASIVEEGHRGELLGDRPAFPTDIGSIYRELIAVAQSMVEKKTPTFVPHEVG